MPTVLEAVRIANRANVPVLLNPSPLRDGFPWGALKLDTLLVNDGEAESIFGLSLASLPGRLNRWRSTLRQRGIECLLVTRGGRSTVCLTAHDFFQTPTLKVKPVDTVGAGDAFAGTFAARRAEGVSLREAIRLANCAGALATLKSGAQESIPSRAATNKALRQLKA
jgi:ribokinase